MEKSVNDIIKQRLEQTKKDIEANMAKHKRNASGRSVHSLAVEMADGKASLVGLETFRWMETGRAGGRVPKGFVQIIAEWIMRKGISVTPIQYVRAGRHKYTPEQRGLMSMASAIAYSISKKGTRLHRTGRQDIITTPINEQTRLMAKEIAESMMLNVTKINENYK